MKKFYTAESVTEGHPDKLCDLIADNVLDACLAVDPAARVACEALATRGHIVVAGEISTTVQPDVFNITRDVVRGVGYDPKAFQIDCWLHAQSPDIAGAVNVPLDDTDPDALGAGDQGIVVGYACKETPQFMPLPVVLAHRLTSLLTLARMTDTIHGIGPDGKAQVTVEYAVNEPEHEDAPLRVSTVVLSVQHAANKNPDELAQELTEQVIAPALRGQPVDDTLEILINPSGSFVLGGPEADTGLTGRKLAVDAYGPFAPHGGGARPRWTAAAHTWRGTLQKIWWRQASPSAARSRWPMPSAWQSRSWSRWTRSAPALCAPMIALPKLCGRSLT